MRDIPSNKIRIYIIANNIDPLSIRSRMKFYEHQRVIESFGYIVINPLQVICTDNLKTNFKRTKDNLIKLIECEAVYLIPDVSLKRGNNVELKISIDLGLLILQGLVSNCYKENNIDFDVFQNLIDSNL